MYSVVLQVEKNKFQDLNMGEWEIFPDDKIGDIKHKILLALRANHPKDFMETEAGDLYLYAKQQVVYTPGVLYQEVGDIRKKYLPFWKNITNESSPFPYPKKDKIQEKELSKWSCWTPTGLSIYLPIGITTEASFLRFITNPFLASTEEEMGKITSNNSELLITTLATDSPTKIIVCVKSPTLPQTYFGLGKATGTFSIEQNRLIREFYQLPLGETQGEIKNMKMTFSPLLPLKLPLHKLFKIWKTSPTFALVKYYTADPLYRMYSEAPPTPFLSRSFLMGTKRFFQREKNTCLFIYGVKFVCKITQDGVMTLETIGDKTAYLAQLNIIIQEMNNLLGGSFVYPLVEHVSQVYFHDVEYQWSFILRKKLDLKKITFPACFTTFFIIEKRINDKEMNTHYIKVGQFNAFNSQDAFIIQRIRQKVDPAIIVQEFIQNYPSIKITEVLENIDAIQTRFAQKIVKFTKGHPATNTDKIVQVNPGNPCQWKVMNNQLTLTLTHLDNLFMIPIITRYLNGIVAWFSGDPPLNLQPICNAIKTQLHTHENITGVILNNKDKDKVMIPKEIEETKEKKGLETEATEATEDKNLEDLLELFGDEDEDEDEEDEDEEDEKDEKDENDFKKGGNGEIDPTGWNLNNYFQKQLVKKDPNVFVINKTNNYIGYARMCASNLKKQPVSLTEDELKSLPAKNLMGKFNEKGEYDGPDVLKYGKNYYMCPRFWCLKTNRPLTQEQIDAGECGGKNAIIETKDKERLPPNKTIYAFSKEFAYPGFVKKKNPNGLCLPCCFTNWNVPFLLKRKQECGNLAIPNLETSETDDQKEQEKEKEPTQQAEEKKTTQQAEEKKPTQQEEEPTKKSMQQPEIRSSKARMSYSKQKINKTGYVVSPDRFPLENLQWGYLPIEIQTFLNEFSTTCQINKFNTNIKKNHQCLLRIGCKADKYKSFIACIANLLYFEKQDIPSIKEMTEILCKVIDEELFGKLQNANLPLVFDNVNKFHEFLKNPTTFVDYTYLWDLITQPNKRLFPNGINLILIEVPQNDMTNQVEIICPSNLVVSSKFDANRKSVFIIKRENIYEPIYSYEDVGNHINIIKEFAYDDEKGPEALQLFLKKVAEPLFKKCDMLPSLPNVYFFDMPTLLETLLETLVTKKYTLYRFVENPMGKIIGVIASNSKKKQGYLPCYPSSPPPKHDLGIITMEDALKKWIKDYTETRDFLLYYYHHHYQHQTNKNNGNILKMVDKDQLVIGFLSPSNQMIPIEPILPLDDTLGDGISEIKSENTWIVDKQMDSLGEDPERKELMEALKISTQSYDSFRNKMKELNTSDNNNIKQDMMKDMKQMKRKHYLVRLNDLVDKLKEMGKGVILFENVPQAVFSKKTGKLVLPDTHSLTHQPTKDIYYLKLADELLRYPMVRSFFFETPRSFYSFGNAEYNLDSNEVLMLQSQLTDTFFESLRTSSKLSTNNKKYIHGNLFDTLQPLHTQPYDNYLPLTIHHQDKKQSQQQQNKNQESQSSIQELHIIKEAKNIKKRIDKPRKTRKVAVVSRREI